MANDIFGRNPLEIETEDAINELTAKINTSAADDPELRDRCFDILRHEVSIDDQRFKDEVERRVDEVETGPLARELEEARQERDDALKQAGATAKECESLRERIRLLEQETQNDERTDDDGQE